MNVSVETSGFVKLESFLASDLLCEEFEGYDWQNFSDRADAKIDEIISNLDFSGQKNGQKTEISKQKSDLRLVFEFLARF